MMTCDEFTSLITDYLDGRVPHGDRIGMWIHKLMCVRCRNYYRQFEELIAFMRAHGKAPEQPLPEPQRNELIERFKCSCQEPH